jgi:hypothetical protein
MGLGSAILIALLGCWGIIGLAFRREIARAWREPVLRVPVLIIESDDWGPGPEADADALAALAALLERYHDAGGRPPVVTLGVLLSTADTRRHAAEGTARYRDVHLDAPLFARILQAMLRGRARGLFALQLHGMAHYWPPALVAAAATSDAVREWLTAAGVPRHESLPSALQVRWADASVLPSKPLPDEAIDRAVAEEVAAFARILGEPPRVVVPPTFLWDARAEAAWVAHGIETIVTPGRRYSSRTVDGTMSIDSEPFANGEKALSGATYVVRDVYFEPALGHRAERALEALALKKAAGRPTLLETHRFNFTGEAARTADALAEVGRLLGLALGMFPTLRFMSTQELATALRRRDPSVVTSDLRRRVHAWLSRLAEGPRLRRVAMLTGLVAPVMLLRLLTRQTEDGASIAMIDSATR